MIFHTKGKNEKTGSNHEADVPERVMTGPDDGMMGVIIRTLFYSIPLSFIIQIRHDQFLLTVVILHDVGLKETWYKCGFLINCEHTANSDKAYVKTVFYIIYSVLYLKSTEVEAILYCKDGKCWRTYLFFQCNPAKKK